MLYLLFATRFVACLLLMEKLFLFFCLATRPSLLTFIDVLSIMMRRMRMAMILMLLLQW